MYTEYGQRVDKRRRIIGSEGRRIIASVYHFLKAEYVFTKTFKEPNCDLSHLSNITRRTAEATQVSQRTVVQILKEKKIEDASRSPADLSPANKKVKKSEDYDEDQNSDSSDERPLVKIFKEERQAFSSTPISIANLKEEKEYEFTNTIEPNCDLPSERMVPKIFKEETEESRSFPKYILPPNIRLKEEKEDEFTEAIEPNCDLSSERMVLKIIKAEREQSSCSPKDMLPSNTRLKQEKEHEFMETVEPNCLPSEQTVLKIFKEEREETSTFLKDISPPS